MKNALFVKSLSERIDPFREIVEQLRRELPIDLTFLSEKALADLPGKATLSQGNEVFNRLNAVVQENNNENFFPVKMLILN